MAPPPFNAMVLSAGFGTRLRPLTDEIPKPLVPIGGVPVLGLHLQKLHQRGAGSLFVNTHYHADKINSYISSLDVHVHVQHEVNIRGTAGGVAGIREQLEESVPLVIVNGDIVGELPIVALLDEAHEGLTMAVTAAPVGEGTVGLGGDGRVVRLRGEIFGEEIRAGDYMGVACLGGRCRTQLPMEGCLVGDWALPRLREGEVIRTVMVDDVFADIGSPRAYLEANLSWLANEVGAKRHRVHSKVAPGVELVDSVVGEGASITGRGRVEACVLLPGAQAQAPLYRSIVTPAGTVIEVPD